MYVLLLSDIAIYLLEMTWYCFILTLAVDIAVFFPFSLYVRHEWLCASPHNKNVRKWLQKNTSKILRRNVHTGRKERNKSKHKIKHNIVKNTTGLK